MKSSLFLFLSLLWWLVVFLIAHGRSLKESLRAVRKNLFVYDLTYNGKLVVEGSRTVKGTLLKELLIRYPDLPQRIKEKRLPDGVEVKKRLDYDYLLTLVKYGVLPLVVLVAVMVVFSVLLTPAGRLIAFFVEVIAGLLYFNCLYYDGKVRYGILLTKDATVQYGIKKLSDEKIEAVRKLFGSYLREVADEVRVEQFCNCWSPLCSRGGELRVVAVERGRKVEVAGDPLLELRRLLR